MPPSPNKSRTFHKSSGKPPRHKDRDRSNGGGLGNSFLIGNSCSDSSSSNGATSSTSAGITTIRKDEIVDIKDIPLTLPEAMPLDQVGSLPRFSGLAQGENLSLDELDGLQLELELLLSSVLVRELAFSHQSGVAEQLEKGKLPPKVAASPGKRILQPETERPNKRLKDNSGKPRETSSTPTLPLCSKPAKVKCSVVKNEPLFDVPDITPQEAPKPTPPKNDMINRFWVLVNQYCQEITADDIKVVEELTTTQNEDNDYQKVPPLGRHYTLRWAQEDLMDEQKESAKISDKKKIKTESGMESCEKFLREVDMNGCNDDVAPLGPLTQRVISGLVEENVLMSENIENKVQGVGIGRPGFIKNLGLGNAAALEKRIKKELQEQGIIEIDNCNEDDDDEILSELKRCQAELKAVSSHNQTQLNRLLKLAREALVRHDLKKKLTDVDAKVIEAHRTIAAGKQKKKTPLKKDKEYAWKALKERETIVKQLDVISKI